MRIDPTDELLKHAISGEESADDRRAPLLGRWRNWYYFTAGTLVLYIIALTLFSRWFS